MNFVLFITLYAITALIVIVLISIFWIRHKGFHKKIERLNVKALDLIDQGNLNEAILLLEKAIVVNPRCPVSHANLSLILCKNEAMLRKALDEINLAIELSPLDGRNYNIRANILIEKLHQAESGVKDLIRAKELGYLTHVRYIDELTGQEEHNNYSSAHAEVKPVMKLTQSIDGAPFSIDRKVTITSGSVETL